MRQKLSIWSETHNNLYTTNPNYEKAEERVLDYVWDQMRKNGERSPPFIKSLDSKFIRARKIRKIIYRSDLEHEGYLLPVNDGFVIFLKKEGSIPLKTQRTTLAHELGHTFFFNLNKTPPELFYKLKDFRYWSIEGAAFKIGRQILMPHQLLLKQKESDPSIDDFIFLQEVFDVTKDILARRIIQDLEIWDAFMFFTEFQNGKLLLPQKNQRFKSNSFKSFILERKWSLLKHIIENLVGTHDQDTNDKSFMTGDKKYRIEVKYNKKFEKVSCLLESI